MGMDKKPETPLSQLTDDQKAVLKSVADVMAIDKITVSYSIEERTQSGRKASAFYSVTASRGTGAEIQQLNEDSRPAGYTPEEAKIARLLLSKHVVASVYDDAVRRGMMNSATAKEELTAVITRYDHGIVRLIQNGCACKEPK